MTKNPDGTVTLTKLEVSAARELCTHGLALVNFANQENAELGIETESYEALLEGLNAATEVSR